MKLTMTAMMLHVDLWQHVSCGFLNKIYTCVNKWTAKMDYMNWEPEEK